MKLQVMYNYTKSKGFTLIELLIIITIVIFMLSASFSFYGNRYVSSQISQSKLDIVQMIRIARQRSFGRWNNSQHGIFFEINAAANDKVILFQGNDYATRDIDYDREHTLPSAITLSTTLANTQLVFSRGKALPNNIGTVTLTHEVQGDATFILNSFGVIE